MKYLYVKLTICNTLLSNLYRDVLRAKTYLSIVEKKIYSELNSQRPHQAIISIPVEKAYWMLTYMLFRIQSNILSALSGKDQLEND